jgi:hypothetical protein
MERVGDAVAAARISGQIHQSQSIPQPSSAAVARSMTVPVRIPELVSFVQKMTSHLYVLALFLGD